MISQFTIAEPIQTIYNCLGDRTYLLNTINLDNNTISSLYSVDGEVFLATDTITPDLTAYMKPLVQCPDCQIVQIPNHDWDKIRCGHCGIVDDECAFSDFIY